jgi:predicted dehydrogenase
MKKLKAAVIGFGVMGKNHARVLSNLSEVEFVGVVDPLVNFKNGDVSNYKSLDELVAKGVDYCVVSVPTINHEEISIRLMQKGVHVLIEKPISHSLSSAQAILKSSKENQVVAAVGHIERFNSALQQAKLRIQSGQLGVIYQVATRRQGPFPARISDVGVIKDLATHDIDLTRWITGNEYEKLNAFAAFRSGRALEDLVVISGILESSIIISHLVNWLNPRKERSISITGESGTFEIDTLNSELKFYENGTTPTLQPQLAHFHGVVQGDIHTYAFAKPEPLMVEHENFRDAILGRTADIVSLEDAIQTLKIAEATTKSYQSGITQIL